jgi:hypothetical protein
MKFRNTETAAQKNFRTFKWIAFFALLVGLPIFAGCGGGGGTPTVVLTPPPSTPGDIYSEPSVTPSSSDKVSYISTYWYNGYDNSQTDYEFQQVVAGASATVGVKVYGSCQSSSGNCFMPGVPVIFRTTDSDGSKIGPDVTAVSDANSIATASVPVSSISVSSGGSQKLTVTATVEDTEFVNTSYPAPKREMIVNVIATDLVPAYSASVDQDVVINIIEGSATPTVTIARTAEGGMGYGYGTYASVRVKNNGNVAWWGFSDPLNRVYLVLDNGTATASRFFSNDWYSTTVVSDLGYYGSYTMPGETTSMNFYLEANQVTPGKYAECFKLQTKPTAIDTVYYNFALVNPVDIAGSHFCVDITVQPESLPRASGTDSEVQLFGKLYWASLNK